MPLVIWDQISRLYKEGDSVSKVKVVQSACFTNLLAKYINGSCSLWLIMIKFKYKISHSIWEIHKVHISLWAQRATPNSMETLKDG